MRFACFRSPQLLPAFRWQRLLQLTHARSHDLAKTRAKPQAPRECRKKNREYFAIGPRWLQVLHSLWQALKCLRVFTMNRAQWQHETLILVAWRPCESQEHRRQHPPESKTGSMHYIKRETLVAASQHHDRNSVEKLPSRCPACEDLLLLPLNGVALSGGSCLSDVNRPALCLLALLLGDVEEALTERCPLILIKGRSRRNVTTAASLRRHCSSSSLAHPAMSRPRRICDATTELEIGCRRLNCLTAYRSHTSSTSVCS